MTILDDERKIYKVYIHTNKINGKKYVGITCQDPPEKRWLNGNGYKENPKFYKSIIKYGWDNFNHEIVVDGLNGLDALLKEGELIRKYQTTLDKCGYNISEGAYVTDLGTVYLGNYNTENYYLKGIMEEHVLPPLDQIICGCDVMQEIFFNLIKRGYGFSYEEEKIILEEVDGKVEVTSREKIKKIAEPDLQTINLFIDSYNDEPRLKDVIDDFKKLKKKIEENIKEGSEE